MSNLNIVVVQRFLKLIEPSELVPISHDILSDQVRYDVLIAQTVPMSCSLRGRTAVTDYLAILRATYLVQQDALRTLVEAQDKVIVIGSEHAWLVRHRQCVRAEWTAIFELHEGLIHSISMMVYRWTVLDSVAQMLMQRTGPVGNPDARTYAELRTPEPGPLDWV